MVFLKEFFFFHVFPSDLSPLENLSSADFFQNQLFFKKNQCLTVWIQIRPNVLLGLVWVQTVCKEYQETTLEGKELNKPYVKEIVTNQVM